MPTHREMTDAAKASLSIQGKSADVLLNKEWLLTNSRGGFASGTVIGCNTRRYHSLLTGSLTPPANRIAALSNCLEILTCKNRSISLSNFEFDRALHPDGFLRLLEFRRDRGVHFEYAAGPAAVTKSIYLLPDSDVTAVVYDFTTIREPFTFSLRPFAALRDFHALQQAGTALIAVGDEQELIIRGERPEIGQLALRCDGMQFEQSPQWWFRFFYRVEQQRGQDCFEDLWSPGQYSCTIDEPRRIVLWAGLFEAAESAPMLEAMELETAIDAIDLNEKEALSHCPPQDPTSRQLFLTADQFIIDRRIEGHPAPSILAGFPWFLDWGRDTFIAFEGLCLATGRQAIAWGVLKTFAKAVSEGMIPNRFDDYGGRPHYNSIDASLWFVHAAFRYLRYTNDRQNFGHILLPAVKWIMDSYRQGTRFGICADADKLITGGDVNTQLTWMDAKYEGIAFTPRWGKAVEINALWYSNLCCLTEFYRAQNDEAAHFYGLLAEQVRYSFQEQFWDNQRGYLNDCILQPGKADSSLRPNQIFAVSLPFSPLTAEQQKKVIAAVEKDLLTPYGLRTLSPLDPRYKSRYIGPMGQRDAAYHQGTVWAFLIGPFIEAYLKVHGFDPTAKRRCRGFLSKLLIHMNEDACLGSISEIFDGEPPHHPRGAIAQAWSVAEVLRAWQMVRDI
ncbi:MAG: amylo-alpha-1,6-glucosidase [Planctomycetales bacterium]|nr:amylo-alpha-1,6-glucosidase [Planctomycetales bacterium]